MPAAPPPETRLAFLGPAGTFTHAAAALLRHPSAAGADLVPLRSEADVVASVADGRADLGLVPLEDAVEGEVVATLDALVFDVADVVVVDEVVAPVRVAVWGLPGATLERCDVAVSHPHALAQCHRLLQANGLASLGVSSTIAAVEEVAREADARRVALAPPGAGTPHGLVELLDDACDVPGDRTRFVVLSRRVPPPTGDDRTMLVLVPPDDRTGVLVRMLRPFSQRDVDIAGIVTRPLRAALGQYCFVATVAGHRQDPAVRDAIAELLAGGVAVKLLGSYPAWREPGGEGVRRPAAFADHLPPGTSLGARG